MENNIKKIIKNSAKIALANYTIMRVNSRHRIWTNSILANIEKQRGKLTLKLRRNIDDYAIEAFGSKAYAPWLYVYTAIRQKFYEGWIPVNYYDLIIRPRKDGRYGDISALRTMTNRILNTHAIPDVAYIIDGSLYSRDYKPLNQYDLYDTIFKDTDVVFYKQDDTCAGRGIEKLVRDNFKLSDILCKPDGCFQSRIIPHDFFKEINDCSTTTIRIHTVRDRDGMVTTRAGYLRAGRGTDSYVKDLTAVKVPIDVNTGMLHEYGYMPDWTYTLKHPETGYVFKNKVIPLFSSAKELCMSLHKSFPHFELIGWDFCINEKNEVQLMEWNANGVDISITEATTGPHYSDLGWENLWKR